MKQFISLKNDFLENEASVLRQFYEDFALAGSEIYMDDFKNRNLPLFDSLSELEEQTSYLIGQGVKRLHCSYWAWPTTYLTRHNFNELVERMGSEAAVYAYYGDLSGKHMLKRWVDEYRLATSLGAEAYVFHLIDYAPIDGLWDFTINKTEIAQAMIAILQAFINVLLDDKLLSDTSPLIELENAGWGLEHGTQTVDDYRSLFAQLYDPYQRLRITWDLNHLLHAMGQDESGKVRFFLPKEEKTAAMLLIEEQFSDSPEQFAMAWLTANVLDESIKDKVSSIHLSDCHLKKIEYFVNGRFCSPYYETILALPDWDSKENYGVEVVLTHYDSHLPLGKGVLEGPSIMAMIKKLAEHNPEFAVLHELKNTKNLTADLSMQQSTLFGA